MAGYHNLALFVLWLHLWLAEPWSTLPSYFLRDCLDRLLFISKCYSNRNCHCSYHFYHSIASVFYSISIRRSHWTAPDHWSLHNLEPSENDSFNWATLLEIIKVFWSSHNWATLNYISLYPHMHAIVVAPTHLLLQCQFCICWASTSDEKFTIIGVSVTKMLRPATEGLWNGGAL